MREDARSSASTTPPSSDVCDRLAIDGANRTSDAADERVGATPCAYDLIPPGDLRCGEYTEAATRTASSFAVAHESDDLAM